MFLSRQLSVVLRIPVGMNQLFVIKFFLQTLKATTRIMPHKNYLQFNNYSYIDFTEKNLQPAISETSQLAVSTEESDQVLITEEIDKADFRGASQQAIVMKESKLTVPTVTSGQAVFIEEIEQTVPSQLDSSTEESKQAGNISSSFTVLGKPLQPNSMEIEVFAY